MEIEFQINLAIQDETFKCFCFQKADLQKTNFKQVIGHVFSKKPPSWHYVMEFFAYVMVHRSILETNIGNRFGPQLDSVRVQGPRTKISRGPFLRGMTNFEYFFEFFLTLVGPLNLLHTSTMTRGPNKHKIKKLVCY